jgi:hypothetical protein
MILESDTGQPPAELHREPAEQIVDSFDSLPIDVEEARKTQVVLMEDRKIVDGDVEVLGSHPSPPA